ncbi:uncharacterized protein LOC143047398 [Mytilus galloprovincialis]|uniref:uncharacterized protein LOC143047398 n=1 Tax=Mytilus galloprovincialis TaxID=29158 RepID=UPI003F7C2BF1
MAFCQSIQKGQVPLSCGLCETETKISLKCIDCDLLMCIKCRDKVHAKFKNAKDHRVVDIKDIGLYAEEMDFTNIKCRDHTGQNCCLFCESCNHLVCPLCISKTHNGHCLIQISESYETKLNWLKQAQVKVQSNLQILNKCDAKIEEIQKSRKEKYKDTKEKMKAKINALNIVDDEFTERIETELDQKNSLHQKSIEKEQITANQLKKKVDDQISKLQDIIDAKDAVEVFSCSCDLELSISKEMELLELNISRIPKFCPEEITQDFFGSLQNNKPIKMTISEQFVTGVSRIDNVSACSDESIWISCHKKPGKLNKAIPEEGNLKDVHRIQKQVFDMAITQSADFLVSTGYSELKLVNDKTGEITNTKYKVDQLLMVAVHVTKSNKVLVGAISDWSPTPVRSCIITMNATGEPETIYEHDKNNTPIINFPWRITSTSNGRIFILDKLSNDFNGQVVVFNEGDVIQVYKGHSEINCPDKPFKPTNFAVTPLDNIIVTNLNMDIFHILNSSGQYITHYDTADIGIINPYSLCFSEKGLLYIGSTTKKGSNDKAKLYIVDISEN